MMRTQQELDQVLAAIEEEDPDLVDSELEAMRDALLWASGVTGMSVSEFISYYIEDN